MDERKIGKCRTCNGEGWICEEHPNLPWPHDDCSGPGMPCQEPGCPDSMRTDPSNALFYFDRVDVSVD